MKVKQLIDQLKDIDPNLDVSIKFSWGWNSHWDQVREILVDGDDLVIVGKNVDD